MAKKEIGDFVKNERVKQLVSYICFLAIFVTIPLCTFFAGLYLCHCCFETQKKQIFNQIKDCGVALCQIATDVTKECLKGEAGSSDVRLKDLPVRFSLQYDLEAFAIVGYETKQGKSLPSSNLGNVIVGDANIGNFIPDYDVFLSDEDIIKNKLQPQIDAMQKTDKRLQEQKDSIALKQELNTLYLQIDEMLQGYEQEAFLYDKKQNKNSTTYYFYEPVIFRLGSDSRFVRAVVVAGISDLPYLRDLETLKKRLHPLFALILLFVAAFSFVLAKIIEGKITSMTGLLVQRLNMAFVDDDASAVQSALRPSITEKTTNNFEFFSYSKSASNISGDYFDYRKLDDNRYVIIKADVSGHGTAAGVIAAIVATLFKRYFDTWCFEENGIVIKEFVRQVNNFLVELNIQGKFTALLLGVYDIITGELLLCNAGDNVIHVFEGETRKIKTITLANSPAAGQMDNDTIDKITGYKTDKVQLKHGDVVFFYSDGIEENTRYIRNSKYAIALDKNQAPKKECLGTKRVLDILESAMNKSVFVLEKKGKKTQNLTFDFSRGGGTIKDAITGLAAIEKMLRVYKSPHGVPCKTFSPLIAKYTKKVCLCYFDYFTKDDKLQKHVSEDKQLDDFTLLALRRV